MNKILRNIIYGAAVLAVILLLASQYQNRSQNSFGNGDSISAGRDDFAKTQKTIAVVLKAGDKTYDISIPKDGTAYEAMEALASATAFNFKAKLYSGIGYFVEELNGVPNTDDKFWSFYVNGSSSEVGVSQYILAEGDVIEWKLEKLRKF